jgi:hypothetical protein
MRRGLCEGVLGSPGKHWPVGCRPGQADSTLRLRAFHDRNARRRRHPFQPKRTVAQVLASERPLLLALPEGLELLTEVEGA